ncbi:sulfotransferase family protein [Streptomyces sp. NBC_00588]|uniref:sulfotransferase family protein n=1 Tax=Streptomyces sp. NBC_00588 TaxID=2975784 RepID=UPI002E811553|nr:sulfotransferase [Streptomyces sp. NBC_00588]WUB34818.1 sulfotransferase [Streptomyces sp. NBC_00588]
MAQAVSPPRRHLDAVPSPRGGDASYTAPPAPRLVGSPVFVLSSVRSGSTLLRVLLNSHSRIRAPHEMHLRTLHVHLSREFTADAMRELQLDKDELEHLLWDRVLHLELTRSGKDVIVDKTPPNTLIWPRLHRCWPHARYILLLRHPGAVIASLTDRRTDPDREAIEAEVLDYSEKLEAARQSLDTHVVTYEELTAEPERVTRALCDYLGVEWESGMLDYGTKDHGTFRPQLGDWSSTIRSGRIQPARPADGTAALPPRLAELARAWGYPVGAPPRR